MPLTEEEAQELHRVLNDALFAFIAAHKEKPKITSIEQLANAFPEDIRKLLAFEQKDDCFIVKPVKFLGSENFAKIANIVRVDLGGEYVSAGKESHFRIPKNRG